MGFIDFLKGGGGQIISSVLGGGMGLISGASNARAQKEMQQQSFEYGREMAAKQNQYELDRMKLQNEYNREAADYSQELAKEMWEYTGYGNQKRQMIEAGLNPALLYGGGSGGGQTANGGSMSGPSSIQPMALQVGLQAQQQVAQTELTMAQAAKIRQDTLKDATVGMAQSVMNLITSINNNDKIKVDKQKVTKEIEVLGENMEKIRADAEQVRENTELIKFQNRVNKIIENSTYWDENDNEKAYDFTDVIITKFYKEFLTNNLRMDKEQVEMLNEKGIAERLAKDLDLIVQGKINQISITEAQLEKLRNEIDRQDWELKNDKALGDIIESIGGDSKYSKLLMLVINRLIQKW